MESIEKKILDINVFAIFFVEDHPGHKYVYPKIFDGLKGKYIPVIIDILPIRAYWILERKWGIERELARSAIFHFLKSYSEKYELICITNDLLTRAFELSKKLNHDPYDTIYLSAALSVNATAIITTDKDFKRLCKMTGIKYENPVPEDVLKKFYLFK
ncbi:MAG: type II toxin-antitoxin system VapC family toxin [Candidatus Asgardarchaeia archaeon]